MRNSYYCTSTLFVPYPNFFSNFTSIMVIIDQLCLKLGYLNKIWKVDQ